MHIWTTKCISQTTNDFGPDPHQTYTTAADFGAESRLRSVLIANVGVADKVKKNDAKMQLSI